MAENSTEKSPMAERAADLTARAADLSDDVLKSVESGQRAAIDAVRKFVGTVDESIPGHGDDGPSRRETIIDSALDMADKLVKTQYEFIRSVVSSASETLNKKGDAKPPAINDDVTAVAWARTVSNRRPLVCKATGNSELAF